LTAASRSSVAPGRRRGPAAFAPYICIRCLKLGVSLHRRFNQFNVKETSMTEVKVLSIDTITKLKKKHVGQVVIAGSHGGVYAGHCAAEGRVRAVILNDAGIGRERAGIGSLDYLDALGIAAATADTSPAVSVMATT